MEALLTKLRDTLLMLKDALLLAYGRGETYNRIMEPTPSEKIYATAKSHLGQHLTLNQNVPPDLGCAEALSVVLVKTGVVGIPTSGFESTAAMCSFLEHSLSFKEVSDPLPGDIIISPTGSSTKGSLHGHCGIIGELGIMSNDSNTGLWRELFTLLSWEQYYGERLGFPIYYFRAF